MSTASEAANASSRGGWLPFRVAIVIVVVGLLVVTCGSLIAYVLYRGEQSVELLKSIYLEQVADTTVRGLPSVATAAQGARPRYRLSAAPTQLPTGWPGTRPGPGSPGGSDMQWVSRQRGGDGPFYADEPASG